MRTLIHVPCLQPIYFPLRLLFAMYLLPKSMLKRLCPVYALQNVRRRLRTRCAGKIWGVVLFCVCFFLEIFGRLLDIFSWPKAVVNRDPKGERIVELLQENKALRAKIARLEAHIDRSWAVRFFEKFGELCSDHLRFVELMLDLKGIATILCKIYGRACAQVLKCTTINESGSRQMFWKVIVNGEWCWHVWHSQISWKCCLLPFGIFWDLCRWDKKRSRVFVSYLSQKVWHGILDDF